MNVKQAITHLRYKNVTNKERFTEAIDVLAIEITRQKAEIERLEIALSNEEANNKVMYKLYKQARTEAIKEYKEKMKQYLIDKGLFIVTVKNALDEVEKRMGECNDENRNSN